MGIMSFFGRKMMQKVAADNTIHEQLSISDYKISDTMVNVLNYIAKDQKDFLDFSLTKAIELTNSKIGYIYHYSEESKIFTLNSWSKEVMKDCEIQEKQTTYQLDKTGIWGEVVRQRKPIMLNDYKAPNFLKKGYPKGHVELRKFLSIPVFEKDQIIMVVGVANKDTDYTLEDTNALRVFMIAVNSMLKRFELMKAITEKDIKLSNDLKEIQETNQLMIGRELKMTELKKEIERLNTKLHNI